MIMKGALTAGDVFFLNFFHHLRQTNRFSPQVFNLLRATMCFCGKACLSVSGDKIMKAALSAAVSAV